MRGGGRGPRQKARTILPQFMRATKEPRELVWISEHVLSSQKDGLCRTPQHHHHHLVLPIPIIIITHVPPPPPPPPTPSLTGEEKNLLWELNCACTFLFGARRRYSKSGRSPSAHPSLFVCHVPGICSCFAQSSWSTPNAGYWVLAALLKSCFPPTK